MPVTWFREDVSISRFPECFLTAKSPYRGALNGMSKELTRFIADGKEMSPEETNQANQAKSVYGFLSGYILQHLLARGVVVGRAKGLLCKILGSAILPHKRRPGSLPSHHYASPPYWRQ
jgi:hypothetical protein